MSKPEHHHKTGAKRKRNAQGTLDRLLFASQHLPVVPSARVKPGAGCVKKRSRATNRSQQELPEAALDNGLRVLDKFRHCIVCRHVCQKQTESGWEVVGDKHTAAQWLGTGLAPYPDCANQTLSPEEKAELIRIRSRKVWRMKTRVQQLIRKAKDK